MNRKLALNGGKIEVIHSRPRNIEQVQHAFLGDPIDIDLAENIFHPCFIGVLYAVQAIIQSTGYGPKYEGLVGNLIKVLIVFC